MKKRIGILIMAGLFGCATSPKQRETQAEKLLSQKYGEEKVDRDTYLCRKVCIQLEKTVKEELSKGDLSYERI